MLMGISPLLSPDLLHLLASMGHGDEIALVDANFPAATHTRRLVRLSGVSAPWALEAVLSVLPLDDGPRAPTCTMQVVGDANAVPEAVRELTAVLARSGHVAPESLERFAFYDRAAKAFGVVATGELRPYGNILLRKGVVRP